MSTPYPYKKNNKISLKLGLLFCSLCLVVTALGFQGASAAWESHASNTWTAKDTATYMALAKGNSWTYVGKQTIQKSNDRQVTNMILHYNFKVKDVMTKGEASLYVLSNFFDSLDFRKSHTIGNHIYFEDNTCGVVAAGNALYYIDPSSIDTAIALFKNKTPAINLNNAIFKDSSVRMMLPLSNGQNFGNISLLQRNDNMYCWHVDKIKSPQAAGKNHPVGSTASAWKLSFNTLPDQINMIFTAGKGITKYTYRHNGTIDNMDLRLIKFETKQQYQANI